MQQAEATNGENSAQENTGPRKQESDAARDANKSLSRLSRGLYSKISKLQIPVRHDVFDIFKTETLPPSCRHELPESPVEDGYETTGSALEDGYETAEEFLSEEDFLFTKINLFGEDDDEEDEKPIPKEKIMKRIDSHKGLKSYQLAQQLSSKWSTGAGPRISCMRDYPSELQFRVLEQANLSPRPKSTTASPRTTSRFSRPVVLTPTLLSKVTRASDSTDENSRA